MRAFLGWFGVGSIAACLGVSCGSDSSEPGSSRGGRGAGGDSGSGGKGNAGDGAGAPAGGTGAAPTGGSAGKGGRGGGAGSGAAGEGGAGGSGGTGGETGELSLESVEFTAYGEVTLTFSQEIDGNVEVEITPERPSGFLVRNVRVSGRRALVELGHNQLPIEYELSARVLDGGGSAVARFDRTIPASATKSLLAFLSVASGNADMRTWTAAPSPAPASPIEAGNAICQAEAEAAGFSGTFVAWLPTSTLDPVCLALGLPGKSSDNCGRGGTLDVPDYAWVRPDGLPIIARARDLDTGVFRTRLALHADGSSATSSETAWVGKAVSTTSSTAPCDDWTLSTSAEGTIVFQRLDATLPFRLNLTSGLCDSVHRLICLQQGTIGTLLARAHARPGRRVFVTTMRTMGAISAAGPTTGVAAGDRICADEAAAAGLSSAGGWSAWLSDATADAGCRIDGLTGTIANDCNGGTRPADRPFVRVDGVVLAAGTAALFGTGSLAEPAGLTALEGSPGDTYVWTGTDFRGVGTGADCTDFTSNSDVGSRGIAVGTGFWSSASAATPCTGNHHLLCVER